jgi:predicted ATPase
MSPFIWEVRLEREAIKSFTSYPFTLPVVKTLETLQLSPGVTFLVGENG